MFLFLIRVLSVFNPWLFFLFCGYFFKRLKCYGAADMPKRVLDVGQCVPDHQTIRTFLDQHFDVEITQTHGPDDTLAELRGGRYDLVLINRKLDRDYSDGLEIVKQIKAD